MSESARKYLSGHVSAETAHIATDYPYGFRGRCLRRTWIEYKPRHGFRVMHQTSRPFYPDSGESAPAPGAARWNKPKGSTYCPVMVLFLDTSNGHIETDVVGHWNRAEDAETSPESDIDGFLARAKDAITPREEDAIKGIRILRRAASRVKYTIREAGPLPSTPEEAAKRAEEDVQRKKDEALFVNGLIANETAKIDGAPVPFPSLDAATAPGEVTP